VEVLSEFVGDLVCVLKWNLVLAHLKINSPK
jgi:hypothetical protein